MPEGGTAPGRRPDNGPGQAASLRRQLFVWLLPVAGVALFVGALADYLIARDAASVSHDQGLLDAATTYAERVAGTPPPFPRELPAVAQRMLLATPEDRIHFQLRDADGATLAGDPSLPPDLPAGTPEAPSFFDLRHAGQGLRGVGLQVEAGHGRLTLVLATTTFKRDVLMGEILLGMAVPQVVLFLVTGALLSFGIRRGLAPLGPLQREIARRTHSDLRPLDVAAAPGELRPMVTEINDLLTRLDQALQSQRHFIADAAHQLRTPVAGLLAQVEAAERADPAGREALAPLAATAQRLSRLVAQLLALARTEPGAPLDPAPADLADIIRSAANDWLPRAFARECELQFDLAPARVLGSAVALREMLANLIDNALRHGRPRGRVRVACRRTEREAVVTVEDDGPGIPAADRERAFERFVRLPGTRAEGSGLGLAIVRATVDRHGGRVVLDTGELGGLRVEIRLPAA